jgi:hypothetical protein
MIRWGFLVAGGAALPRSKIFSFSPCSLDGSELYFGFLRPFLNTVGCASGFLTDFIDFLRNSTMPQTP